MHVLYTRVNNVLLVTIDIYIIIKQPKYFDLLLYLSYFVYAANDVPIKPFTNIPFLKVDKPDSNIFQSKKNYISWKCFIVVY